ncbi:MAG: cytochrome C [Bacteroidetes bacterium HGW-Bacteroidetes-2]|jgi:mono/diheme cytochrome c family protein|nr:MAG: cytochrome C [Bacteroidetes bacterium HGW-Bacteroidetes-2]
MKKTLKTIALLIVFTIIASCGNSEKNNEKEQVKLGDYSKQETKKEVKATSSADMIDMSNKGLGPIKSITLAPEVDETLATLGKDVYDKMCTACHKPNKKFIGPAPMGVLERRSPEWIMNMILNPEEMIAKDPIAKQLLIESNMAVMANQNLTEADARAVLEYFRTIK